MTIGRRLDIVFAIVVILAASLTLASPARAQSGGGTQPADDDVNRVAKQLYCPVCPNTPLDVCETQACSDWRAQIRDQLAAGWTDAQIIDYFKLQYGERVLAEPARSGFTSLVWILPVIALAIGAAVVWHVLRSWKRGPRPAQTAAPAVPAVDPDILAGIERELQELR